MLFRSDKMKKLLVLILLLGMALAEYISVPHTFVPGQLISSSKVNADYQVFEDGLSDGTKDINLYRLYVQGQKIIDYNKNITCADLLATGNMTIAGNVAITGNVGITGNLTVTGNLILYNTTISVNALNATIITQNGIVVDMDAMQYDVYNFYVKYPYATSGTESVQEQFIANNGNIVSVKAQLGEDATGQLFVMNVLNDGTDIVKVAADTYTFLDVTDTISINANVDTNIHVTANNFLGLQVIQVGSTANGQDLKVQVVVDRE